MGWACWHAMHSILRFSNRASNSADHPCPQLRTRFVPLPPGEAWRVVRLCVEQLDDRWALVDETPGSGHLRLTRKSGLRMFTNDVSVSLWPTGDGRVGIDVTSSSRLGRVDFGQNARNIRDFYRALEASLQSLPEKDSH